MGETALRSPPPPTHTTHITHPTHTFEFHSKLSWESATQRLLDVGEIKPEEWPSPTEERYAAMLWRMYRSVTGE